MRANSLLKLEPTNNNKKRKILKIHTPIKETYKHRANLCRSRDKKFRKNLLLICLFSLSLMTAFLINARNELKKAKMEYNKLDSQDISYQLTRDRLKTNLEKTIDIKEIQRYAMEKLGMVYANEENIVELNVNR